MVSGALGKTYENGEIITYQGEVSDCMYIIQSGQVEIVREINGHKLRLAIRGEGEFFGEMALFEREVRSATVRALGTTRILTIDKKNFLRRIHEDPSLAFHLVEGMSARIRRLSDEVAHLRNLLMEHGIVFELDGPNP